MLAGLPAGVAIGLSCAALVSIVVHSLKCGITPMPSSSAAKLALAALLAELPEAACLAELGSGWGGVARLLAGARPRARVEAYETSPLPYLVSRLARRANLSVVRRDFFEVDLSRYDLIYCYLSPRLMARLQAKLERELKPGSVILSNTFALRAWPPAQTLELGDIYRSRLYVYVKDAVESDRGCS